MKVRLIKPQLDTRWGKLPAGTVIDHPDAKWLAHGGKSRQADLLADDDPTPADCYIDDDGEYVTKQSRPSPVASSPLPDLPRG